MGLALLVGDQSWCQPAELRQVELGGWLRDTDLAGVGQPIRPHRGDFLLTAFLLPNLQIVAGGHTQVDSLRWVMLRVGIACPLDLCLLGATSSTVLGTFRTPSGSRHGEGSTFLAGRSDLFGG